MSKGKILVADDEAKIVEIVKAYLEKEGYQVATAGDGRRALELFQREKPDLIILDLMLPEIDGLEVCRQVRRTSDVPIIMLTARVEDADKLIGLELGADDYITKALQPQRSGGQGESRSASRHSAQTGQADQAGTFAHRPGPPRRFLP